MTKKYTEVIKGLHVFETVANKICVITTCVVLSTCGYSKLQSQSLACW